jgi:hypothetical protein
MAAATTTSIFTIPVPAKAVFTQRELPSRRRRTTHEAGRALEILSHAIEYLTDEFVYEDSALSPRNAQLQAVQILMALNRRVYFECPEMPTFATRFRTLLHLRAA